MPRESSMSQEGIRQAELCPPWNTTQHITGQTQSPPHLADGPYPRDKEWHRGMRGKNTHHDSIYTKSSARQRAARPNIRPVGRRSRKTLGPARSASFVGLLAATGLCSLASESFFPFLVLASLEQALGVTENDSVRKVPPVQA